MLEAWSADETRGEERRKGRKERRGELELDRLAPKKQRDAEVSFPHSHIHGEVEKAERDDLMTETKI